MQETSTQRKVQLKVYDKRGTVCIFHILRRDIWYKQQQAPAFRKGRRVERKWKLFVSHHK